MSDSAHTRLVGAAITLTRTKGVPGTTVADLLSTSGVARRSLYLNFPAGREELLTESARAASAIMSTGLNTVLATTANITDALNAFVGPMRTALISSDFLMGCPIVAAALGGSDVPEARDVAGATFTAWCDTVAGALEAEGIAKDRATSLASLVIAAIEGATVMSIATGSAEPLDNVAVELNALAGSLLG